MSDLSFLVRGRSVDLVAMTAARTLRTTLGLGDEVIGLFRDQLVCIDGVEKSAAGAWTRSVLAHQHWFNPNKHRFASYLSSGGAVAAVAAVAGTGAWPSPWLSELVDTDRPDLIASRDALAPVDLLSEWTAPPVAPGAFAVSFIAYDLEDGVSRVPSGRWPGKEQDVLLGLLWTLILRAPDAEAATGRAEEILVTRTRTDGMLVHPHMEGWTAVGAARPCEPSAEVQV